MNDQRKGGIAWTDFTANPVSYRTADDRVVWACEKVSAGCQNCYAATLAKRYGRGGDFNAGVMAGLTPFLDDREVHRMLTAKKIAGARVFVGDMTDIFGAWVPDEILDRVFAIFALRPDVTWQVLTKRPDRMRAYLLSRATNAAPWKAAALDLGYALEFGGLSLVPFPLPNVWLGVSAEDQAQVDARIPLLLQTPAAVRWVSAEPLLERVDLRPWLLSEHGRRQIGAAPGLSWVVVGGESGPGARPCALEWIAADDERAPAGVVEQCRAAGVPVFVKQLGAVIVSESRAADTVEEMRDVLGPDAVWPAHRWFWRAGLKDRKGGDPAEWPPAFRVREFPS